MQVSNKGRLAVNAMVDLALREQTGPVALSAVAHRQHVSLSYLEQLFAGLRAAGLVTSTRGPGGGYALGRAPAAISVAVIVGAVETRASGAPVDDGRAVLAHDLWHQLHEVMQAHMAGITLADLVQGKRATAGVGDGCPRRSGLVPRLQARPVNVGTPNSVFEFASMMGMSGPRPFGR